MRDTVSYHDYGQEDRREARKWFGLGIVGWIIIVIVAALMVVAGWGISVAISGPKGQGDAIRENNSADNWTEAQADFEQKFAAIKADDEKITNAFNQLQTDTGNTVYQTQYTGLVSHCLTLVAEYNADARSFLKQDWRAADLPAQIETNGNLAENDTDCKENIE